VRHPEQQLSRTTRADVKAFEWYEKAAIRDNADAMFILGVFFEHARVV
jgi:TPR repeat protein